MTAPANSGGPGAPAGSQQQGQEPAAEQGQTDPSQQGGTGQEPGSAEQGTPDLTAITDPVLRSYVESQLRDAAEARQEAARYRTQAREAQGKVTEYERASETAEQTAERERAERDAETERLRQENRDLRVGGTVKAAALEAKAFDAELVYTLVESQVTLDDKGAPTNVAALLTDLKRDKPYLFRRTDAGAGAGADPGSSPEAGGGINAFIRGRGTAAVR